MEDKPRNTPCERWLHVPTRITYRVTFEHDGVVDLEPLHGETLRVKRSVLRDSEAWEEIP